MENLTHVIIAWQMAQMKIQKSQFIGRRGKMLDTILVSANFSEKDGTGVLLVGRKRMNQSAEIVNAFQGKEAIDLYKKLITKQEKNAK